AKSAHTIVTKVISRSVRVSVCERTERMTGASCLQKWTFVRTVTKMPPPGLPAMRCIVSLVLSFIPALALAAEPPDLRTRKAGVDWPKLLGPTGDSVSPEKGILTDWPRTGLRVVWKTDLGLGYAPPTISRGRIFTFDAYPTAEKKANVARLTCRQSETGKELWNFEYPTKYDDTFGYDNGPRCCPLIDGDRVYLHGVEGMLHCVRIA